MYICIGWQNWYYILLIKLTVPQITSYDHASLIVKLKPAIVKVCGYNNTCIS